MSARHRSKSAAAVQKRTLRSQRAQSLRTLVARAACALRRAHEAAAAGTADSPFAKVDAETVLWKACIALEKFEKENPK